MLAAEPVPGPPSTAARRCRPRSASPSPSPSRRRAGRGRRPIVPAPTRPPEPVCLEPRSLPRAPSPLPGAARSRRADDRGRRGRTDTVPGDRPRLRAVRAPVPEPALPRPLPCRQRRRASARGRPAPRRPRRRTSRRSTRCSTPRPPARSEPGRAAPPGAVGAAVPAADARRPADAAGARRRGPRASRIPILAVVLAGVVLTTVAAWYFFLRRRPAPPRRRPTRCGRTRGAADHGRRVRPATPTAPAPRATPAPRPSAVAGRAARTRHARSGRDSAASRPPPARRRRRPASPRRRRPRRRPVPPAPAPAAAAADAHALLAQGLAPRRRARLRGLARGGARGPLQPAAARGVLARERAEGGRAVSADGAVHPARQRPGTGLLPAVLGSLRQRGRAAEAARLRPARLLPPGRRRRPRLSPRSPSSCPDRAPPAARARRSRRRSRASRAADSIVLTNGRVIEAEQAWFEGAELRYRQDGALYALPRPLVVRVDTRGRRPGAPRPRRAAQPRAPRRRRRGRGPAPRAARPLPRPGLRRRRSRRWPRPSSRSATPRVPGRRAETARGLEPAQPGDARAARRRARRASGTSAAAREQYRAALELAPRPARAEEARGARHGRGLRRRAPASGSATTARPTSRSASPSCACSTGPGTSTSGGSASRPSCRSTVVLQTATAFRDTTRAPEWAAAWNDGTIRVPVMGLDAAEPRPSCACCATSWPTRSWPPAPAATARPGCRRASRSGSRAATPRARTRRSPRSRVGLACAASSRSSRPFIGPVREAEATAAYAAEPVGRGLPRPAPAAKRACGGCSTPSARACPAAEALPVAFALSYGELQRAWEQDLMKGSVRGAGL